MKILYDYQIFDFQKIGGISRYFCELMQNTNGNSYSLGVKYSENEYLLTNKDFNVCRNPKPISFDTFITKKNFKGKHRLFNYYCKYNKVDLVPNRTESIKLLKEQNFDVFHPTFFDPYFLEYLGNKPFVLTIHDMIQEKYPEFYRVADPILVNKKMLAEKATKIIAISECTKKDIIEFYGIPENKISVIYHGSSMIKTGIDKPESLSLEEIIKGRYFLFTGNREFYKNFHFFIESISDLLKENKDLNVICTAKEFSADEISLFEMLGISGQVKHIFASDYDLSILYKNAIAFVFPSYYEGFGLPILEAWASECPIILAKASCFYEIAGDSALYFDPKNRNELIDCCSTLLNNETYRKELVNKGVKYLSHFSLQNMIDKTFTLYKESISDLQT